MKADHYSCFRHAIRSRPFGTFGPQTVGQYDPMNLFVSLDPNYKEVLDHGVKLPQKRLQYEHFRAFATLVHETVHWWQYSGTTIGLLLGLTMPVQAHANTHHLVSLAGSPQAVKPLARYHEVFDARQSRTLNTVVNNWYDIELAYFLLDQPEKAQMVLSVPFFECLGHSLHILYGNTLNLLSLMFDPGHKHLPDFRNWGKVFSALRDQRLSNWTYGKRLVVPPLGMFAIIEAQARMLQLRYLFLASGGRAGWDDFREWGLMGEVYLRAFETYLKILGSPWPSSVMHPKVSMFLLVCEIALHPCEGYPADISEFERFIETNSPGVRFILAANAVRRKIGLMKRLAKLDSEAYDEVATEICHPLDWPTPREVAGKIVKIAEDCEALCRLDEEVRMGRFSPANLPVRFYFSRHLRLMRDKAVRPDFFCWPSRWFIDDPGLGFSSDLTFAKNMFDQHSCPFYWNAAAGQVEANRNVADDSESRISLISTYYRFQAVYDLIRQWIVRPNRFSFEFFWRGSKFQDREFRDWVMEAFENGCKSSIADIKIL